VDAIIRPKGALNHCHSDQRPQGAAGGICFCFLDPAPELFIAPELTEKSRCLLDAGLRPARQRESFTRELPAGPALVFENPKVPRLRMIVRKANDHAALGMTVVEDGGTVQMFTAWSGHAGSRFLTDAARRFGMTSDWAIFGAPEGPALSLSKGRALIRTYAPSPACGRANNISSTSTPAPTTIALSARLNTGHW
jgi:hypothetical protein